METIKPRPSRTQIVAGMAQSATGASFTISDINGLQAQLVACAPSWALCGDTPEEAGRKESRRPAEHALTRRFCQLNPRGKLGNIVVDIDHGDGLNLLDCPPPTYTTINPKSGHQQAGFLLAVPVARGGQARRDIQQLAADVTLNITRQLNGDPAFRGFISRGPLCPDHITHLVGGRLWTLAELAKDLPPLTTMTRAQAANVSEDAEREGRNQSVFKNLSSVGFLLKNKGVTGQKLRDELEKTAEMMNRKFSDHPAGPMSPREVATIVKSIFGFLETKYGPSPGSPRAKIHSRDREPLSEAQQQARRQEGQSEGAATKREATRAKLRAAVVTLTAQGQRVNAETLSLVAGVSKRTVFNHSDIWN